MEKNITKKQVTKNGFYKVETSRRSFIVYNQKDIINQLEPDENSYSVTYIEYVGDYNGKTDVISINSNEGKKYYTVVDENTVSCFEDTRWRSYYNDSSLESYYEVFRNNGIRLRNDIYKRYNSFRKEVNRQLTQLLNDTWKKIEPIA